MKAKLSWQKRRMYLHLLQAEEVEKSVEQLVPAETEFPKRKRDFLMADIRERLRAVREDPVNTEFTLLQLVTMCREHWPEHQESLKADLEHRGSRDYPGMPPREGTQILFHS